MPRLRSLFLVLLATGPAAAEDWPQWLGPRRDGTSTEKIAHWETAPKVVWRQPVGEGHSSPVVAGGKVFLFTKVRDKEEEEVTAFDAADGKVAWHTPYPRARFRSQFGAGPQGTPAVVDGRVYSFGATGVLTCFEADGGKQVWQVDTLKKFQVNNLFFGTAGSPLVEDGKVLINVGKAGDKGATVAAFTKEAGELAWSQGGFPASYSSPIAFGEGKQRQVVFLTQQGLASFRPSDGEVFWKFPLVDRLNESSTTPVHLDDLLVASSVTYGSVGLRLQEKAGKPAAMQLWKNVALTCYFATPVPVGKDHLYMVTGELSFNPQSTLRCVDIPSGKELWNRPKVGKFHAALLRTGNDKLLMLSDSGDLVLLDPDPKGYKELARSKVCGQTWAHPALSGGKVYLRDEKELLCLQLPE
jgi:outer membrane protein assembly factor BamB